jgi:flagellar biosynthesis/type III secretory pathway M-ring protein FliF/YscJ
LADVQEEYAVQNTDDSMASEHLNIVWAWMWQQDSFYKIVQSTIIWWIIVLGVWIFTGIILRKRRSSKKKQ